MKSIAPGLQKISAMIDSKVGGKGKPDLEVGKKKKKHLNFNFMKKK